MRHRNLTALAAIWITLSTGAIGAEIVATGAAVPTMNQHGLTGSWFQPSTNGQGVEIEVFKDLVAPDTGFVQGSWFTYDHAASGGADHNRWFTFGGSVSTLDASATFPLYQNVGGNFNAPPVTTAVQVGTVTLAFGDCTHATMSYTFSDGTGRSGALALQRLTPNVTCALAAPAPVDADFALSGNWFDPARSGQGMVVEVNPVGSAAFLAWYTYGTNAQASGAAGQRWYTAQGSFSRGARTLSLVLYETTGGLFDRGTPTPVTAPAGAATLTFSGCNAAVLKFAFNAGSNAGQRGTLAMTRPGPAPAGCAG